MSISPILYEYYKDAFLHGNLKLKEKNIPDNLKKDYSEMVELYIEKKESNVWYAKDEFELSLLLVLHGLNYNQDVPADLTLPCHVVFRENEYCFEFYSLEHIVSALGGIEKIAKIIANKPCKSIAYLIDFNGYKGYTFSLRNSWRKAEFLKPISERNHQYFPISVLRTTLATLNSF